MCKKKPKTLNWSDFQALGNPENAPIEPTDEQSNEDLGLRAKMKVRVYLERKNRGGKTVSIIKGIDESKESIKNLGKQLKSKCGVGGNSKNGEIVLQGDHRQKIVKELIKMGFKDVKNAGV